MSFDSFWKKIETQAHETGKSGCRFTKAQELLFQLGAKLNLRHLMKRHHRIFLKLAPEMRPLETFTLHATIACGKQCSNCMPHSGLFLFDFNTGILKYYCSEIVKKS